MMVVDDDVYVRLDRLVALLRSDRIPNERFYGGNVAEKKQLKPTQPIRNPESRYYLPMDTYPIAELPSFVAGAHFVLSRDVVEFIARNRRDLRGLKGLDDATIALWMLALQIRPVILLEFQIVRSCNCTEELVSYADLAPHAIRTAHWNLVANDAFCTGFNYTQWFKQYDTIDFSDDDDADDNGRDGDVEFSWDLEIDPMSPRLHILTTILSRTKALSCGTHRPQGPTRVRSATISSRCSRLSCRFSWAQTSVAPTASFCCGFSRPTTRPCRRCGRCSHWQGTI
jgi:hypothetical protein